MLGTLLFALTAGSAAAKPPRLVVLVSVDQMRADYLRKFKDELKGGLVRLVKEGFLYPYAEHAHIPTETAPGHAAMLTGRAPREHGIVGTGWWDRDRRRPVTSAEDPVHGSGPAQLLGYTVGDMLKAKHPQAKVICLGQKDRTAILLCGKKANAAVWYDRSNGRFTSSSYYGALPGWVEAFNAEGRIQREYRRTHRGLTEPPTTYFQNVYGLSFSDDLVLGLAERALVELELGADETPDLLALGFGANDSAGHEHGPESAQVRETIANVDRLLGRLLDLLDRRVGRYALVLSGDHGIPPDPDGPEGRAAGGRRVASAELHAAVEDGLRAKFPLPPGKRWVEFFRSPHVYLDRGLAAARGVGLRELRATAAAALGRATGVLAAYTADELEAGLPSGGPFAEAVRRSYYPARSGDLLFVIDERTQLDYGDGNPHGHGSPNPHDARVPLIWHGAGLRRGAASRPALIYDLAPTLAVLLEVPFPKGLDGSVLTEALAP